MKKYSFFWVSLLSLLLIAGKAWALQFILGSQDYLIYSTIIDSRYLDKINNTATIRGQTAIYTPLENLEFELNHLKEIIPKMHQGTIVDFIAKNTESYSLKNFINQRADYLLVNSDEINLIFGNPENSWERFYEEYPDSDGIITLSRAGFNEKKNQALVYVANQWEDNLGTGIYYFLERQKENFWSIKNEVPIWHGWNVEKGNPPYPIHQESK